MGKKPSTCAEFILVVINLVFTVMGVSTMGFGLICFLLWKQNPSKESNINYFIAHHMHSSNSDILPKAWFIYITIGIGAILFILSCCGCVGTAFRSPFCLLSYFVLLVALVTVELGLGAFIFFENNWKEVMPKDRTGWFYRVYHFVDANWKVIRWVALGVLIFQVIAMIVGLYLVTVLNHARRHRDNEYLPSVRITPNHKIRKPSTTKTTAHANASAKPTTKPTS